MPFEIPSSWVWTTLGEMFTLQAGKNITTKDIYNTPDTKHRFPCYGGNGLRGYVSNYNKEGRYPLIGRQGALCGNINEAHGQFYATEHAVVVETYCETDIDWAVNVLVYLNLNQYATSTAQPGLSVGTISEVMIPVPPLAEQQKISQRISNWFTLIDQIEQGKADIQVAIKQTKSKILDLAIHGKLVPQDPNDEPASELLKRINPKVEITCDNVHRRKLPQGWSKCYLKDVLSIIMGQSPNGETINHTNGIEFHQGKLCFSEIFVQHSNVYTSKPTKIVEKDSLLLCVRAPVGIVNIVERKVCIGRGLCALKPKEGNTKFYFYWLQTLQDTFEYKATGTTFKAISGDIIKYEYIMLPPLVEQQRIVQKIEELFSSLNIIQKALEV
ncbi:restriction endonuclease subunit S [Butyricimonas sp. Marseille-P3923]|uniref:restriction endonuclease subunit S n=1 Tax=Butyricimonas sp. Marseille-P3923 TaxID=1987504 RepID=UPI001145CF3E|nr:restriction endonuclease subunit S [Butyricimonas sp. Marseille-P3923]